jgi:hypothetical protein
MARYLTVSVRARKLAWNVAVWCRLVRPANNLLVLIRIKLLSKRSLYVRAGHFLCASSRRVHGWFLRDGNQVAIDCGGKHFAGREILYDTRTGKELASFDEADVPMNQRPQWSNVDTPTSD